MTEEKKVPANVTKVFNAGVKAKLDKNGIVMKIATECANVGITQALNYYNKLGKEKGLILSNDEKREKIDAALAKFVKPGTEAVPATETSAEVPAVPASFNREGAAKKLQTMFDMTASTASNHIRRYAKDNDIELPSTVAAKASVEQIQELVKAQHAEGKSRQDIIALIAKTYGYSDNTAGSHYAKAAKALGIVSGRSSEQRAALIQYLLVNGEKYDRKSMIKGMVEHFKLSEATANSYYGNYLFAKDFAKAQAEYVPAETESEAAA